MAWYNNPVKSVMSKLNPAQPAISGEHGPQASLEQTYKYEEAYEEIEVVNRAVNMLIDDVAEIPAAVGEQLKVKGVVVGIKKVSVDRLINTQPNPYQDINTFRRNLVADYLLDGNIFIYYDGAYMYHLPADKVTIEPSKLTHIKEYTYNREITFKPGEIIHIKENSFRSIYRGTSRLKPAVGTINLLLSMKRFQKNFFKNGAVPGLILKSPDTLSEKIKNRLTQSWQAKYRPESGGRSPLILDGGLEIDSVSNVNFKELDFQQSIEDNEKILLKALGVPPILLDSGNNANLRPNMRLYYLESVLPIVRKINFGLERYFGFVVKEAITDIPALQPELRDQSAYYSTLVNGGILTPNEARIALGMEELTGEENNDVRVPANIAGSATNPGEGGRPSELED